MADVRPFTYLLGEPPLYPNSGFRKQDGIHGSTGAQPMGSASITGGQDGILIERSNAELQNNELSRRDIPPSAYRSFEANLHLHANSEYERNNNQRTANRSNSSTSQPKSAKAAHEVNVPVVPPKPTNDVQTEQPPADDKNSTDCTVGGVTGEQRLNCGQSKEGPNPHDDSDSNDEYLYGQVKRHKDSSKTERWEDMNPKRIPYEIPAPFSYTEPIRAAAAPTWGHGEKQPTSIDENKRLEFEDVVIDDFSDLCSSLSSVADSSSRDDHHQFVRSAPVAPSKTESREEEEFTESDDPTKRPKLPEIFFDASSMNNSRNAPLQNSTFAAKPFTYLTGEFPPSKSAFLRSGEISGASSSPEANASPRPVRNPSTLEKDTDPGRRMVPKVQNNINNDELSHQVSINAYQPVDAAVLHPKTYYVEQKAPSDYTINQQKTIDLQNQSKATTAHVKKVPIVPPKRANDQTERSAEEGDSSGFLRFASRGSLFGDLEKDGQADRLRKDGQRSDHSGDSELLYGQVKHRYLRDVKTDKDSTSSPSDAHEIPPPFSYTEPIRPAATAPFQGEKQSPSNDKGKRSDFEGGGAVVDLDDLCPSSSPATDVQTLFDNFILVKATNPEKLTRQKEFTFTFKEPPTKKPKFLEIFDPPPPSLIGPRKLSILGVTSTESSDFHVDCKPKIANGNNYYDRTKGPVSTFDNPDYNISSNYAEARTNLHTVVDFRSDSSKSLVASSNSMDRTGETPVQVVSSRQRRCDSRLCIAILVTALVTSVICLGAGFVAGWFGRGKSIGN